MSEIWKDINGYEGLYQISNLGRVRSLAKQCGFTYLPETIRRTKVKPNGYEIIILSKNNRKKTHHIHRLVAMAFLDDYCEMLDVNHKDGNKLNNNLANLEMCTRSENIRHAYDNGLSKAARGERNGKSKLTSSEVLAIKQAYKDCPNYTRLGRLFNVNPGTIYAIINGITWREIGDATTV